MCFRYPGGVFAMVFASIFATCLLHTLKEKQTQKSRTIDRKTVFFEASLQRSQKPSQNDLPEPSGEGGERPKTTPRGAKMAPGGLRKRFLAPKAQTRRSYPWPRRLRRPCGPPGAAKSRPEGRRWPPGRRPPTTSGPGTRSARPLSCRIVRAGGCPDRERCPG